MHVFHLNGKKKKRSAFLCKIDLSIQADACPLEYRITDPNHSYCSEPFPNVIDQRVSLFEQKYIVDTHNHERQLTRGTNMEKMVVFFYSSGD